MKSGVDGAYRGRQITGVLDKVGTSRGSGCDVNLRGKSGLFCGPLMSELL